MIGYVLCCIAFVMCVVVETEAEIAIIAGIAETAEMSEMTDRRVDMAQDVSNNGVSMEVKREVGCSYYA